MIWVGANIYRNKYLAEQRARGETVLLLAFHVPTLQYFLDVIDSSSSRRYQIESVNSLIAVAAHGVVRHVTYNCAVSFPQPLMVIDVLVELKRNAECILLVTVHDYFIACPSHFLINSKGEFCGVPDTQQCESCLPQHKGGFVSVTGIRDIAHWRREWAELLIAADEVRLFSESSWKLLRRAFPLLSNATWRIVPHDLHINVPKLEVIKGRYLHIGVVGTVGTHKGAQIVKDIASEIARRALTTRITVIGTIEAPVFRAML